LALSRLPVGIVGGSDKASSAAHEAGRSVNLYVEVINGKPALKAAPGFFRWLNIEDYLDGAGVIRGLHTMGDRLFCVVGNQVGEITPNNAIIFLVTLNTSTGRVGISDNDGKLIVGDGLFWLIDPNGPTISQILTAEGDPIEGYISRWINGTTLYFGRDSSTYYYSEVADPGTVLGLSFFSAEANPDKILNAHILGDQIVIVGERTVEWHFNDANDADNPFKRIQGGWTDTGCVSRWASCKFDNTVIMVARNENGAGKVVRLGGAGSAPQIISNQAVENAIAKVLFSFVDLTSRVTMWAYDEAGHSFAILNLPAVSATVNNPEQTSMTWAYDAAVPPQYAWNERAYLNPATGEFERSLSDHHAHWRGRHYTGAYDAPIIYEMSLDYRRENTEELVKRREVGPINPNGAGVWGCKGVRLVMERGVGRDGGVQGSEPKVMMQSRWGTGRWSNEVVRDIGKIGEGVRSVIQFGPCGRGEFLSLRFSVSDPVSVTLVDLELLADR
jgi:hypothetical protein